MRFSFLVCVLFILCTTTIHSLAQTTTKAGPMIRQTVKEGWTDVRPMGETSEGMLYLLMPYGAIFTGAYIGSNDFYIGLVNAEGELVRKKKLDMTVGGEDAGYIFFQEVNGIITLFTSVEERKKRLVTFYAHVVDTKTLELKAPTKLVELSFASVKRDYERAIFRGEPSRDKSKMLISYSLLDKENTMLNFGYVVFDAKMKKISDWEGSLDMRDGVYLFDQFRISNKGDVFLLTRFFSNNKDFNKNAKLKKTNFLASTRSLEYKPNYEFRVVKFEKEGASKVIRVENTNDFYNSLDIGLTTDGKVVLIGFYADNEENLPSGAVCVMVDPIKGTVKETGKKSFETQFMMPSNIDIKNNGLSAGKDQYLSYRFILKDIQYNSKGGYTLIGERNVTQTKRSGQTFYTVNHLDDLAVVDVTSSGAIAAVHRVEKSQQVADLDVLNGGYFFTEKDQVKYFAFANIGKGSHESVVVKITPDGKQTRSVLFNPKDSEVSIRPTGCSLHKNRLVMYATKNARYVRWMTTEL